MDGLKVRVGVGLGTGTEVATDGSLGAFVDALEEQHFDSLWLSDQLSGPSPDPLTSLAFAAGRTRRLKLGTSVLVVPGRNPVVLAEQMATLDRISDGRFLPAVGLGAVRTVEQSAFGVERGERAAWFDEALGLMRRLWTEEGVTHSGERFAVEDLTLGPRPVQDPLEVWLGGRAPSELRRVGRLGDGWLPSFCTVESVAEGWEVVTAEAAAHDRSIDPQHLGALVAYAPVALDPAVAAAIEARLPGVAAAEVVPSGLDALAERLAAFIDVGASKFVVVPLGDGTGRGWELDLADLADAVLPLQT